MKGAMCGRGRKPEKEDILPTSSFYVEQEKGSQKTETNFQ